jgi:hypothetical protein
MERPDLIHAVDHEGAEAEAQAAMARAERERVAMSAREFVSERDALEDAWSHSSDRDAREEGW